MNTKNSQSYRVMLFTISILIFIAFVYYSYLVAKEHFTTRDFDITVKLQDHISRRWDLPFSILSLVGSFEIVLIIWLFLMILCLVKKYWLSFLGLFFLLPFASFLEVFGKTFVYHPAPPFLFYRGVLDFNFPSHFIQSHYSYPSGHMTRTAFIVFYLAVLLHLKTSIKVQFIILPFLCFLLFAMAISRVYLGEHWTTDVVGGILAGSSLGIITALLIPIKARTNESPRVKTRGFFQKTLLFWWPSSTT